MTPKQFIRYTKWLDKNDIAICDGCSVNYHASIFDLMYPLFIFSGITIFMFVIRFWDEIKSKIF